MGNSILAPCIVMSCVYHPTEHTHALAYLMCFNICGIYFVSSNHLHITGHAHHPFRCMRRARIHNNLLGSGAVKSNNFVHKKLPQIFVRAHRTHTRSRKCARTFVILSLAQDTRSRSACLCSSRHIQQTHIASACITHTRIAYNIYS